MKAKSDKQSLLQNSKGKEKSSETEVLRNQLARALADYDNLRKRVEREKEEVGRIVSLGLVLRLLSVLDILESAQNHLKDAGLAIAINEFKKVLAEEGLEEIRPKVGDKFDESLMEAVEVVKGESDNTVSEMVLVGWKFNDGTVVRHAKVKVIKKIICQKLSV